MDNYLLYAVEAQAVEDASGDQRPGGGFPAGGVPTPVAATRAPPDVRGRFARAGAQNLALS